MSREVRDLGSKVPPTTDSTPQSNLGKTNVVFTPDFFFPVRIPSILLDEHLQQSGKEFIEEIAIASHVNQIQ
jgi:hypothetical protein